MIKKTLNTIFIVVSLFLLLIVISFLFTFIKKTSCSQENPCQENYLCNNKQICVASEKCSGQKPEVCINLYAPVCGDNGKEYSNNCFACMAGVNSYYKGNC